MNTIKITPNLLSEYQCTSGKFIILPNRIEKIDSVARIESNRNFFCPNWNALSRTDRITHRPNWSNFINGCVVDVFCICRSSSYWRMYTVPGATLSRMNAQTVMVAGSDSTSTHKTDSNDRQN